MTEPFDPNPPLPRPAHDAATQKPGDEAVVDETPAAEAVEREEERRERVHPEGTPVQKNRTTAIRIGAAVAIALAVGVGLWLVLRDNGSSSTSPASSAPAMGTNSPAVPISLKGLQTIARLGFPIYWAGTRPGTTYEMTKKADNSILIRYLPNGAPIGSKTPYLTIGTYPMKNAFAVTSGVAKRAGSVSIPAGNDRVAFYSSSKPTNVYFAQRGSDYQIEVYDPVAQEAKQLVASGKIQAVR
jgi:hypothetical protein